MKNSFIVLKNIPTQQETDGDCLIGSTLHNRIFLNCEIEVKDKIAIIRRDNVQIEAIISLDQFSILKYDNQ